MPFGLQVARGDARKPCHSEMVRVPVHVVKPPQKGKKERVLRHPNSEKHPEKGRRQKSQLLKQDKDQRKGRQPGKLEKYIPDRDTPFRRMC
jgi:hypothetical protein